MTNQQMRVYLRATFLTGFWLLTTATVGAQELCGGLVPTIVGTEGDDQIRASNRKGEVILGLGGNDVIIGGSKRDVICGGDGDDIIAGRYGDDALFGGLGKDVVYGTAGDDELDGGPGDDLLVGGSGADIIFGGEGNDVIAGEDDADVLSGGLGEDVLYGNLGNDELNGGRGNDVLKGGPGIDNCDGYIGVDRAWCETEENVGLLVKQVQIPVPEGFTPASGRFAGQTLYALDGALFVPRDSKKVAMVATHGTFGEYYTSLTGWIGWWMEQNKVTVLTLNRRDSQDYGNNEGGGGTIYEDTVCDVGRGVDYLISLGYEQVIVQGHSKGTSVAPVYPVYYNNCGGKEGMTAANDPNVAGVITTGTLHETRESGSYVPWGSFYDQNIQVAKDAVAAGLGDQIQENVYFAEIGSRPNGPRAVVSPPRTANSYLSYWDNPLRDVRVTAKELTSPFLIIHTEGDFNTLREWSDALFLELQSNGNDVSIFRQAYTSLGYIKGNPFGTSAHQIANADARDEAMARINQWMIERVPGSEDPATAIDMLSIEQLPDFNPALTPTPTNP